MRIECVDEFGSGVLGCIDGAWVFGGWMCHLVAYSDLVRSGRCVMEGCVDDEVVTD